MTCDNLLCTRQKCCAFPLQCILNKPVTFVDVSTNYIPRPALIREDPLETPQPVKQRSGLSDKDLVAKIEFGKVLLAEDLKELIERFKAYSKFI